MTLDTTESAPAHRVDVADRFHTLALGECGVDARDILVSVHANGTITIQLAARIGSRAEPDVQTVSLPRGRCGFVGTYDGSPGLSIDLHREYVAETDDASIRGDALAILDVLTGEDWGARHRVGSK